MTAPALFNLPAAAHPTPRQPASEFPDWLRHRLEQAGLMDPDTGATRRARARLCKRCRQPVMRGLDGDTMAVAVDCDPAPLNALGEALALLSGRQTYELRWLGDRYEIDHRDQWRIAGRPAGTTLGTDVLVRHDCDQPPNLPTAPTQLADRTAPVVELTDPPF